MTHRSTATIRASLFALFGLALCTVSACDPPEQDVFKSQGGISPDPTGAIDGTVLYVGPRPTCEYEGGRARRVVGRVLLTLFQYDNPPPPEGKATTALNLFAIPGEDLFSTADCRAQNAPVDLSDRLTKSVPFYWSQIELGKGNEEAVYQIRGFYDTDEDMNPFFSVRNLPTAGDIIGAALQDPQDPSQGLMRVRLPGVESAPNGYIREGVIVALGNYVWTERPAFEASPNNRYLESDDAVQVTPDSPSNTVFLNWRNTCENRGNCGFSLLQLQEDAVQESFAAGDVQLDFDPEKYAWVSAPVDILKVNRGAPDVPRPDGVPDPHPVLGSNAGVPYFTPIVIMTRTAPTADQAAIETAARIPNVRLVGSTLLDDTGTQPLHRVQLGELPIAVPPAAVVELDLLDNACRVPYLATGNFAQAWESRFAICHELPTGLYGISTIQGAGGGEKVEEPDGDISQSGVVFDGSILPGQAWTLPNDLAIEDQVGAGKTLASQGRNQLFVVFDPFPDETGDCTTAPDADQNFMRRPVNYRGICAEGEDQLVENPEGIDGQGCLPQHCCDNVKHLCNVPLCPPCNDETCPGIEVGGRHILSGPTSIVRITDDGWRVPNCVPFEMPPLCCQQEG